MADWSLPLLTTLYTQVLSILKDRDLDAATMFVNVPTSPSASMMRFVRASLKFQEYDGAAWQDKLLAIVGGGTGAATAAGARTNLGLGTLAVQDANNVNITGGILDGVPLDARDLVNLVPTASLGSGAANSGTWLRGDQTWQAIPAGTPSGVISMYGGAAAPTDWLMCDGAAVSRTTYAALFAVIGTSYGAGDLSTTFNLPDFRQRFPLGKAASGTGSTLGSTGGAIDHTHTSAAHTHTVAAHGHTITVGAHTHSISSDGDHSHTLPNTNTTNISHAHSYSGTTGGPSAVTVGFGAGFDGNAGNPSHTHDYSGSTAAADSPHSHSFSSNTGTTGAHSHTGSTGSATPSGSASTTALTTDSTTPGATGSNNPPYQVVNFIVKT